MLRTILGRLAALLTLLCAHPAWAAYRVDSQSIEIGDWRFIPIVEDDGVNPAEVHSFVALLDDGAIAGSRIGAIWYAKNPSTATGWESVAWESPGGQDHWGVFGFVQGYLNIPEGDWENWDTDQAKPAVIESAGVPVGYYRGMFESNPLNEIVGDDPMRDQLIDALVENAYEAAQVEVDRESAEHGKMLLDAFSEGVEFGIAGGDGEELANSIILQAGGSCTVKRWYGAATAWALASGSQDWKETGETKSQNGAQVGCWVHMFYSESRTRVVTIRHTNCAITTCTQTQVKTTLNRGWCPSAVPCTAGDPATCAAPTIDDDGGYPSVSQSGWSPQC